MLGVAGGGCCLTRIVLVIAPPPAVVTVTVPIRSEDVFSVTMISNDPLPDPAPGFTLSQPDPPVVVLALAVQLVLEVTRTVADEPVDPGSHELISTVSVGSRGAWLTSTVAVTVLVPTVDDTVILPLLDADALGFA